MKRIVWYSILSLSISGALMGCGNFKNPVANVGSQQDSPTPYPVADAERTQASNQLVELRKQMLALEGNLIAPAKEDLAVYANFLSDPTTGLARVFPRGSEKAPILTPGEGAYYQFKGRTNIYGRGNDVEYDTVNNSEFTVGFAGADYGFFAQLGKTDIRQVNSNNPTVAFALSYPSSNGQLETVWRAEKRKFGAGGASNDGVLFASRSEAIVGMSYVVRSVTGDNYDIVAVFQVVRRDPNDGSLILAWKLLKDFGKPTIRRN